jgi:hypothetical protein
MSKEYSETNGNFGSGEVQRVIGGVLLGFSGVIIAGMVYGTVQEMHKPTVTEDQAAVAHDTANAQEEESAFTASGIASATVIAATGSFLLYRTRRSIEASNASGEISHTDSLPLDQIQKIDRQVMELDYPTPQHIVDLYLPKEA